MSDVFTRPFSFRPGFEEAIPQDVVDLFMKEYPELLYIHRSVGGREECGCWHVVGTDSTAPVMILGNRFNQEIMVVLRNPACKIIHDYGTEKYRSRWNKGATEDACIDPGIS